MPLIAICWALLAAVMGQQTAPSAIVPTPNPIRNIGATQPALNYDFFKTRVQPIFLAKRPGHARCVSCHGGSQAAVLILQPLSPGATTWTDDQSRKNFEAAKLVVIPGSLQSPLLTHPLAEEAGGDFFHSGGKHFNSQNDPEWQTLKAWVMGQTLNSGN